MSTETVETAPQAGDRRGSAEAGPRREAVCAAVGREIDPEVVAIAKRRKFSDTYKLKILDEIDRNPRESGVIIRREGLYSSSLTNWRKWRDGMSEMKKPTSPNKKMHNDLAKLERENTRLKLKLKKAEILIEFQKKASEMLTLMSQKENDEA